MGIFVLSIPWLLLFLIGISLLFLILKKWFIGSSVLVVAFFLNWWAECIPLRFCLLTEPIDNRCLKVMSFNIDGSMERISAKAEGILNLIKEHNPDIVFLAEFSELYPDALDTLLKEVYPYTTYKSHVYYSQYFYSRYPILGQKNMSTEGKANYFCHESEFNIFGDTITIYGCHLASNNYTLTSTYLTPDSINNGWSIMAYLEDIRSAYNQRESETKEIIKKIERNNNPIIMMGDFNDVGGSTSIRNLENAGLGDAWWEGGFGYGATIHRPLPYRIDHIMHNKVLKLKKIKVVKSQGLSDHDALYAEFEYKLE